MKSSNRCAQLQPQGEAEIPPNSTVKPISENMYDDIQPLEVSGQSIFNISSKNSNDGTLSGPKQSRVGKPSATSRVSGETSMKTLVEYMVKAVVKNPDSVIIREIEGSNTTIFELSVAPEDMGRAIGKQGRVVNAMRTLLQVIAVKEGKRVTLEIV